MRKVIVRLDAEQAELIRLVFTGSSACEEGGAVDVRRIHVD